MIRCLAASVIHDDRLAVELGDENSRQRRQEKREVGGREHVDHIRLAEVAEQQRPVGQLCRQRPQVSHLGRSGERAGRRWIDRDKPGANIGVAVPGMEKALGLDSLSAKDAHRGSDYRDSDWSGAGSHVYRFRALQMVGRTGLECPFPMHMQGDVFAGAQPLNNRVLKYNSSISVYTCISRAIRELDM